MDESMNKVTVSPSLRQAVSRISALLRDSLQNGLPAEPNWWSALVQEARLEDVSEGYLCWLVVRDLLSYPISVVNE